MPVEVGWGGDNIALSIRSFFGAIHLAKREGWRVYLSVPEVPETCKQIPPTISLDDLYDLYQDAMCHGVPELRCFSADGLLQESLMGDGTKHKDADIPFDRAMKGNQ